MQDKVPSHLAIIMDGNGRWAQSRGRPRIYGHLRGARVAKNVIGYAAQTKIKHLTLFAFSTENWFRPEQEVNFLMRLLARQITREQESLVKNNIRFEIIGDSTRLPIAVRQILLDTVELTKSNTGLNLIFALSYGGRQEVTIAAKKIAQMVSSGVITPDQVDEALFATQIDSAHIPDPDMILRTSGEHRLSNFFLWQAAYSEIHVIDKMWPDFSADDFAEALAHYASRKRRFGRVHSMEPTL